MNEHTSATPVKVLIVGAHHEEIEAECPNTAAALAAAGCDVTILNPIGGWNWTFIRSLGPDGRKRTIADAVAAARELGCRKVIWDYPVARADRHQAEIMDRMAEFFIDFQPDIVLMHYPLDSHADHRLVAHVTRQVLGTAVNIVPTDHPEYRNASEVYAFQTGVSQAYHFQPDLLVRVTAATMAAADRAVDCFRNTAPKSAAAWKLNFHTKAAYWGNLTGGTPSEALKFLGPQLPLQGFLLKRILGNQLLSAPFEPFYFNRDFQL